MRHHSLHVTRFPPPPLAKSVNNIDDDLVRSLVDQHAAALTLYARQWCSAPEDAVQEAFVDFVKQAALPRDAVAWLYTSVRRRAMNIARAESRRAKHQQQAGAERDSWFVSDDAAFDEQTDFQSLLQRLARLDREIVVARIWGELSFAQIAALTERPLSSVHRKYQQAIEQLGQMMSELEPSRQAND